MDLNKNKINELSIDLSAHIIEFMGGHGLLKHNQLYDLHYNMDTNESNRELTIESQAMIQGLSFFINNYLLVVLNDN